MKSNQTVDFPMTLIIKNSSKNSGVKKTQTFQSTPLVHICQGGLFPYNIGTFCNAVTFPPSLDEKFPLQR